MQLFQKEQYMPGKVIDRDSMRGWKEAGSMDAFTRARIRVQEILASYERPELDPQKMEQLHVFVSDLARKAGLEQMPGHELSPAMAG